MMQDVLTPEEQKTLLMTRVIWAAMLLGLVTMVVLVALIHRGEGEPKPMDPQMLTIALVAVLGTGMVGYFARMQAYKRFWVGTKIEAQGYLMGNLLLFALVEAGAMVAVVLFFIKPGSMEQLLPAGLSVIILAMNFPNGRPMLGGPGIGER